jgi:hypothetical protein
MVIDRLIQIIDPVVDPIAGNTDYNIQVSLTNDDSQKNATVIAKHHNISQVNYDNDCVKSLKDEYKIKDDIMVVKTEKKVKVNGTATTKINIDYYNQKTREKLNKTKCKKAKPDIKIKVAVTTMEKAKATKFRTQGIDVFNPNDPAFRTNCFSFVDPNTEFDTTLNYRINNYFINKADCLANGCNYKNLGDDDYMTCDCNNGGTSFNATAPSGSNILACSGQINVILI